VLALDWFEIVDLHDNAIAVLPFCAKEQSARFESPMRQRFAAFPYGCFQTADDISSDTYAHRLPRGFPKDPTVRRRI
jgi:hypothetical protein